MKVVAHRGASAESPENTMAAFGRAAELGADAIEFDVHLTADGHPVVMHDQMLDRTTTGTGPVFATIWSDLAELDAGAWYSPEFAGEHIPTLSEVLALEQLEFELELKGYGEELVDGVLGEVTTAGVLDRVEFTGWNLPLLGLLHRKEPAARIGLFSNRRQAWMTNAVFEHQIVGTASTAEAEVAHVFAENLTASIAERLHELGLVVHANDASSRAEMERAVLMGADRLSANDVTLALSVVRERASAPSEIGSPTPS
jgi:glycerophosphoryl diester phosphodiesterase